MTLKIGIITFHRADNYGALLQALALLNTLKHLGYDTKIIDYRCKAIENCYRYRLIPSFSYNPVKICSSFIYKLKRNPALLRKSKKCSKFRQEYFLMTKSVVTNEDKGIIEQEFDLIITGSDQIWNNGITDGVNEWYAYKKRGDGLVVVSYAASAGSISRFSNHYRDYEEILRNYDMISVREKTLQEYLSNAMMKEIPVVLDPTLLIENDYWNRIIHKSEKIKCPFVLYYDVEYNSSAAKVSKIIAEAKKLKVVSFNQDNINEFEIVCAADEGPTEFLWLIHEAEYVVTSSFHATVFSILFHKRFISLLHSKTGDRIKDLLYSLGLSDHIIDDIGKFNLDTISVEPCWEEIDKKLGELRADSIEYLNRCIELTKNKKGIGNG